MKNSSENILKRYQDLQPKNGSSITPRPGYYYIVEIAEQLKYSGCYVATALWKEDAESNFLEEVSVKVSIEAFKLSSENPESFEPEFFLSKLIHVKSQVETTTIFRGEVTPFVKSEWSVELSPVNIEKSKPSFLDTISDTPESINDILDQMPDDGIEGDDDGGDSGLYGDEDYDDL